MLSYVCLIIEVVIRAIFTYLFAGAKKNNSYKIREKIDIWLDAYLHLR